MLKFTFSAKFPIGLHVILQIQINKSKTALHLCKSHVQIKSVCTLLEIILKGFVCKLYDDRYAVYNGRVSGDAKLNWALPYIVSQLIPTV